MTFREKQENRSDAIPADIVDVYSDWSAIKLELLALAGRDVLSNEEAHALLCAISLIDKAFSDDDQSSCTPNC